MFQIDCIACDLDDTLVDREHDITKKDKEALQAISKQGIRVILATGRHYTYIREYIDVLDISGFACTSGGGMIYDFSQDKIVTLWELPIDDLKAVISYGLATNLPMVLHKGDRMYLTTNNPRLPFIERYNHRQHNPKFEVAFDVVDFSLLPIEGAYKFSAVNHPGEQNLSQFDWIIQKGHMNVDSSSDMLIDFTARDASKGTALKYLSDLLGFDLKRTVVIGDNDNDISMFEVAGIKVAMENGVDELKQKADYITIKCGESGVWYALKHFLKVL